MKFSIFLVLLTCLVMVSPTQKYEESYYQKHFLKFIDKFNKNYDGINIIVKYNNFKENLDKIELTNINNHHALHDINEHADLTDEEFNQQFLSSFKIKPMLFNQENIQSFSISDWFKTKTTKKNIPENFDWRDKIPMTQIEQQSTCGSCWTFATSGHLETQYFLKTNKTIILAEQQLLDCDKINEGCGGGSMTSAFDFLIQEEMGMMTQEDYGTYQNKQQICKYDQQKAKIYVKTYKLLPQNEEIMKQVLYESGPIPIGFNSRYLRFYQKGIHSDPKCDDNLNHAVLLVGYGVENGVKYWILKNQWGPTWGEEGYFRMQRDVNMCGIATYASIAEVIPK